MTKTQTIIVSAVILILALALGFGGGYYYKQNTTAETKTADTSIQEEGEVDISALKAKAPDGYGFYSDEDLNYIAQRAILDSHSQPIEVNSQTDFIGQN